MSTLATAMQKSMELTCNFLAVPVALFSQQSFHDLISYHSALLEKILYTAFYIT